MRYLLHVDAIGVEYRFDIDKSPECPCILVERTGNVERTYSKTTEMPPGARWRYAGYTEKDLQIWEREIVDN
jgi:hypothetical protein